ncbi:MAG: endonuclease/exonuclease/phosphatase family protein, partial [Polaribacter sp.]
MKKMFFFNKMMYFINSIIAILLLVSFLLPYISPKTIPVFAVLSVLMPILLILNVLFVIYWLIKLKKHFLLSSVVLIVSCFIFPPLYKISANNSSLNNDLKVMSYNVKSFDLFFSKKNTSTYKNGFDFIATKNPDVLAIQEFYKSKKIKISYPYSYIKINKKKTKFGMAIYSKFKIINSGSLNLKNTNNNIIFADIIRNKDTIRVYNLHLESFRIKNPYKENFGEKNS